MAPLVSARLRPALLDAVAIKQREAFAAGVLFSRSRASSGVGVEPRHRRGDRLGRRRRRRRPVVLIVSGSSQLDLPAYADYLSDEMLDA